MSVFINYELLTWASHIKGKEHWMVLLFLPAALARGEVALTEHRTDLTTSLRVLEGALRVVPSIPEAPGRGLSTLAFMFSFLFTAAFSSSLCSECVKRYCMCVCACFHQTAFSSVLWALPDKCMAVIRQFDASFLHALLIESWKPPFRLVWPSYLCLPVISHLHGGILDVSHFKMF